MKTDFILTYDKDREPDARILEALVSDIANCKMVVYDTKKSKDFPKVDKQTWLFLGEDCSSHLQFKSKYDKYDGIQIGWKGAKAWIRVSKCSLDDGYNRWRKQFFSEYKKIYKKYDLELKNRVKISKVEKYWYYPLNYDPTFNYSRRPPVFYNPVFYNPAYYPIAQWFKLIFEAGKMFLVGGKKIVNGVERNRIEKELQNIKYNYATLLFVDQYIKPFLTEQPKDLLSEDE